MSTDKEYKLYNELYNIREKHRQIDKNNDYINFLNYYNNDILILYKIFIEYYVIDYNIFQKMVYLCTNKHNY
jgi:hypothetical protein